MNKNIDLIDIRMEIFKMLLEKNSFSTDIQFNSFLKQAERIVQFVLKDNDQKVKIVEDKSFNKSLRKPTANRGSNYKASDLF